MGTVISMEEFKKSAEEFRPLNDDEQELVDASISEARKLYDPIIKHLEQANLTYAEAVYLVSMGDFEDVVDDFQELAWYAGYALFADRVRQSLTDELIRYPVSLVEAIDYIDGSIENCLTCGVELESMVEFLDVDIQRPYNESVVTLSVYIQEASQEIQWYFVDELFKK